jgi:hypothetical protein
MRLLKFVGLFSVMLVGFSTNAANLSRIPFKAHIKVCSYFPAPTQQPHYDQQALENEVHSVVSASLSGTTHHSMGWTTVAEMKGTLKDQPNFGLLIDCLRQGKCTGVDDNGGTVESPVSVGDPSKAWIISKELATSMIGRAVRYVTSANGRRNNIADLIAKLESMLQS